MSVIPYQYRVDEILSPTKDIRLITLHPIQQSMSFEAGQYIEAILPNGNRLPLSIANAPKPNGSISFHIRLVPNTLAVVLMNTLLIDKTLTVAGPFGNATGAKLSHSQTLFLAGGVGFAPIQSILSALLDSQNTGFYHLFWGVKYPKEIYAGDLLQRWKRENQNFDYTLAISEPFFDPNWKGERGLVHTCLLRHYPELSSFYVVASGPQAMIDVAYPLFCKKGLSPERFISDAPLPILSETTCN